MAASSRPGGLRIIPNFCSREEARQIVDYLDQQSWVEEFEARRRDSPSTNATDSLSHLTPLRFDRRQQFYGSRYVATTKKASGTAEPMRGPIKAMAKKIGKAYGVKLGHCIVNEYGPGGSIGAHTDSDVYGDYIFGLSLVCDGSLQFTREERTPYDAFLPRRSLLVMHGSARWRWRHALKSTKSYPGSDGTPVKKGADYRRISLTFRYKRVDLLTS